jgi:hypothetical protein
VFSEDDISIEEFCGTYLLSWVTFLPNFKEIHILVLELEVRAILSSESGHNLCAGLRLPSTTLFQNEFGKLHQKSYKVV